MKLVYNTRRTGEVVLDGRRFLFRRVYFPETPTAEWFMVDLLQQHDMAGVALSESGRTPKPLDIWADHATS